MYVTLRLEDEICPNCERQFLVCTDYRDYVMARKVCINCGWRGYTASRSESPAWNRRDYL